MGKQKNKYIALFNLLKFFVSLFLGAITIIYNAILDSGLVLTPEALVGIFNGTVKFWDDPLIQSYNPDVYLPPIPIMPVHRTDPSYATLLFSEALSDFSQVWSLTFGAAPIINW